jgi:hypothetical protein
MDALSEALALLSQPHAALQHKVRHTAKKKKKRQKRRKREEEKR